MVMITTDNMTALSYIRKQGGTRNRLLLHLALDIWEVAIQFNIQLQVQYIPSLENTRADFLSRMGKDHREWCFNSETIQPLIHQFNLTIDLFTSNLDYQLPRFVSWRPCTVTMDRCILKAIAGGKGLSV